MSTLNRPSKIKKSPPLQAKHISRRSVIQSLGLISTHAFFPSVLTSFIASCKSEEKIAYKPQFFTEAQFEFIREIIDMIIPVTATPSASQVNSHIFLDEVFTKCLTVDQQELIRDGIEQLMQELRTANDKPAYLTEVDKKAYANDEKFAYFRTIKQYTLIGFFTSEEGTTMASNYVKIPGDYQGEFPADENTLNYGKTNLQYYF